MSSPPIHTLLRTTIATPIGALCALGSEQALCSLEFALPGRQTMLEARLVRFYGNPRIKDGESPILFGTRMWLDSYFAGRFIAPPFELDLRGTPFELRVWKLLQTLAPGTRVSYGELAQRLAIAAGARAVGGASRRNPIALIVPCHRVVGSTGTLTGYGGGLPNKSWLLQHENSAAPSLFEPRFGPRTEGTYAQPTIFRPDRQ